MDLWNQGAIYETWDKVTAKVVDRRVERISSTHDQSYEQRVEIDVRYSFNGTEHLRPFVNPHKLLTDPKVEISVNPEKPSQSSLGFERGLFLAYAIFFNHQFYCGCIAEHSRLFPTSRKQRLPL